MSSLDGEFGGFFLDMRLEAGAAVRRGAVHLGETDDIDPLPCRRHFDRTLQLRPSFFHAPARLPQGAAGETGCDIDHFGRRAAVGDDVPRTPVAPGDGHVVTRLEIAAAEHRRRHGELVARFLGEFGCEFELGHQRSCEIGAVYPIERVAGMGLLANDERSEEQLADCALGDELAPSGCPRLIAN